LISFELSQEQKIFRDMAGQFAKDVLRPQARKADDERRIAPDTLDQLWGLGVVEALIDDAAEEGGQSGSALLSTLMLEELGWGDAVFAAAIAAPLGFVRAVAEQGSASQKEKLLPLFTQGKFHAASVALAEPEFLTGVNGVRTTATRDGDSYRLNGVKWHVPLAAQSSHFLVITRIDGKLDALIVAADLPGVKISKPENNLGLVALEPATVTFENVSVPANMRLGENRGCDVQRMINSGRVGASAALVGLCRAVYEHSVEYTKERVVHGSALARKQSVAFRLVDMFVEMEACRWMCWHAAWQLDKRHADATRSATLTQTYTAEQAAWISDEGVQLMGGHGFMRANPVEMWYRNAKSLSLLEAAVSV
jgi:alkylation response protein AidB-like acyl-CoA dehydrogenase